MLQARLLCHSTHCWRGIVARGGQTFFGMDEHGVTTVARALHPGVLMAGNEDLQGPLRWTDLVHFEPGEVLLVNELLQMRHMAYVLR